MAYGMAGQDRRSVGPTGIEGFVIFAPACGDGLAPCFAYRPHLVAIA